MINFGYIRTAKKADDNILKLSGSLPQQYKVRYYSKVRDQENRPMCVAYALNEILYYQGKVNKNDFDDPFDIYKYRISNDMEGMIPRETLTLLKESDRKDIKIKNFARIDDQLTFAKSIFLNGPGMICLPVYSMNKLDFWNNKYGRLIGGHAVACTGWNDRGFILKNSWGNSWGDGGYTYINFDEFKIAYEAWSILI